MVDPSDAAQQGGQALGQLPFGQGRTGKQRGQGRSQREFPFNRHRTASYPPRLSSKSVHVSFYGFPTRMLNISS